jgi:hypothetical protein
VLRIKDGGIMSNINTKHTKGPWFVDDNQIWGNGIPLAEIYKITVMSKEEQSANARLIAAAPELLEALQEFIKLGSSAGSNENLIAQATLVIAKATGDL